MATTPTPSPFFFAMFPLQEVLWDKDGLGPLAGGVVTFYKDPNFTQLKDVYQQSNVPADYSYVNIGPVLTLSSIGSFIDGSGNNFIPTLYPWTIAPGSEGAPGDYEPYFITVYSAGGVLQFTVVDWPPNPISSNSPASEGMAETQNLLTNSQFSEVLFKNTPGEGFFSFTVSGTMTTEIAPNWYLKTTGSGSVMVTQEALIVQTPGDASYALQIQFPAGVSGSLYQRIDMTPRMLVGYALSGYFEASSPTGTPYNLALSYIPSDVLSPAVLICSDVFNSATFTNVTAATVAINGTVSVSPGNTGYVDISLSLPSGVNIAVTNFQVVGVPDTAIIPGFIQNTVPIQNSQLFSYWQPALNYKPIPSYLVGWDFPLNPAQPLGVTVAAATLGAVNRSRYIWDQTIAFQSVDNSLSFSRDASTNGFKIATAANTTFAIIQYLDAAQAKEILAQRCAVRVKGKVSSGTLIGTVGLYWTADATLPSPPITTNFASLVSAVDPIVLPGTPIPVTHTTNGTWNQVANQSRGASAAFTLTTSGQPFDFSGFDASTVDTSGATFFAIVLSFDTMATTQAVTLDYVSLVSGDISTRPAPQTPDQVLRECEYYYERSYAPGVATGTATMADSVVLSQGAVPQITLAVGAIMHLTYFFNQEGFGVIYKQTKRAAPAPVLYSTNTLNTPNNVTAYLAWQNTEVPAGTFLSSDTALAGSWVANSAGKESFSYNIIPGNLTNSIIAGPQQTVGGTSYYYASSNMSFHYVADARLGVV